MGGMGQTGRKHVLVVDAAFEASHNLCFLLKIKDCRVSQVRNIEELINWFAIRALIGDPINLLLINNFSFSRQSLQLITEHDLFNLNVPVLIVNRQGSVACIENLQRGLEHDCGVTVCEPAYISETLDLLLQSGVQPADQAGMTIHRSG